MTLKLWSTSKALVVTGLGFVAVGIVGAIARFIYADDLSSYGNLVSSVGDMILTVIGGFGYLVGNALQSLEARLDRLENR